MINAKVLIDAVRNLLFFIDSIVYSFIPMLYRLILYLANVDLFTGNIPIQGLIRRIYIIVGVFMLFKLSFSIMNYIVDPDAFSDQSKGFSNMVKRVLIAVVLLVSIPWFFGEAYMLQAKILKSGVLQRLILGETGETSDNLEKAIEISAKDLQFLIFSPFFHLNYNSGGTEMSDSSGDLSECKPTKDAPSTHIIGSADMANSKCFDTIAKLMDNDPDVESSGVNLYSFFRFEDDNGEIQDYRKFDSFGGLVTWALSDGEYAIKYRAVFSTIFGGYLVFLLLSFCIDVASRSIRLLFLQILSPVAIISSVDPTTSGDRLKEWAKECLKVWASLFLRLSVIFLMMQLVRIITNSVYSGELFYKNSGIKLSGNGDIIFWVFIFLILGIFQAANKIPDLIEKATGIKMSGDLQLNPFKALKENAGVGLISGTVLGGAVGAATGGIAGAMTSMRLGHNPFLGGLSGLASGAIRGQYGGLKNRDISKSFSNALQAGGRVSRAQSTRAAIGGWRNMPLMVGERFFHKIGAPTSYDIVTSKAERYDAVNDSVKALDEVVEGKMNNPLNSDVYAVAYRRALEAEQQAIMQFRNGQIGEDTRRRRVENARREQNEAKYNFVDEKVQSGDEEISALRRKVSKTMVDSGLRDAHGRRFNMDTADMFGWKDISDRGNNYSIVKRAQAASTAIKSDPGYDDLRDVSDALKGTDYDAHMKH